MQGVVLVTGCSPNGLGHEICKAFLKKKYRVFATARRLESLEPLKEEGCDVLAVDVTKPETIAAAAKELATKTGGCLDILINNAGGVSVSPSITEDPSSVRSIIDTNLLGPILVGQSFIPLIIASNRGKSGVVVNVSSMQAVFPVPWQASYAASKAGLRSITTSWRMELEGFGIRVIEVVAGGMTTSMAAKVTGEDVGPGIESGLYWNWAEIDAVRRKAMTGGPAIGTAATVAHEIVAAALKKNPPSELYSGTGAWLFKYIPYFPLSWIESMIGGRLGTKLVSYRS